MLDERIRERELDEECLAGLFLEFEPHLVKRATWVKKPFDYIEDETIEHRLDDVLGPSNWEDSYREIDATTVECTLSITLPSGRVVRKCGVGARKDEAKAGDVGGDWVTGFTYAFKRAAKKHGVGRYLNGGGWPRFVQVALDRAARRERESLPARVVDVALPAPAPTQAALPSPQSAGQAAPESADAMGKRFYNWACDEGKKAEFELVRHLTDWGKRQGFPGQLKRWSDDEIKLGIREAKRRVASLDSQEIPEDAAAS